MKILPSGYKDSQDKVHKELGQRMTSLVHSI